jgi:hypothetical protein
VTLLYRLAGDAVNPIVFLHGGPGFGIDDGGYDLELLALKGHSLHVGFHAALEEDLSSGAHY